MMAHRQAESPGPRRAASRERRASPAVVATSQPLLFVTDINAIPVTMTSQPLIPVTNGLDWPYVIDTGEVARRRRKEASTRPPAARAEPDQHAGHGVRPRPAGGRRG